MSRVLIQDLDDALVEDYRRAAKVRGRSLEAELREALDRARPRMRLSKDELIALSLSLQAMTPQDASHINSTAIIRKTRDEGYGFSG